MNNMSCAKEPSYDNIVSGPLKPLVDKSFVEQSNKKYRIIHGRLRIAIKTMFGDPLG